MRFTWTEKERLHDERTARLGCRVQYRRNGGQMGQLVPLKNVISRAKQNRRGHEHAGGVRGGRVLRGGKMLQIGNGEKEGGCWVGQKTSTVSGWGMSARKKRG